MHVIGIVGASDSERSAVLERLASRLSPSHRVATIERLPEHAEPGTEAPELRRSRNAGADHSIGLTEAGGWVATGDTLSVERALAKLAPDYDICVVDGIDRGDVPSVILGDIEHDAPAIVKATGADAIDYDLLVDRAFETEPHVTLESLVESAKRSPEAERAGAIATFTGRVRALDAEDDQPTQHLEFEYYDGVADERLDTIKREIEGREGVFAVLMHHRTGRIEYGEDIVFVVVLAGHRQEAFEAVQDGINRLKAEVPIFKKEVTVAEEFWVHDRAGE